MSLITDSGSISKAEETIKDFIEGVGIHRFIYLTGENFGLKNAIIKQAIYENNDREKRVKYTSTDKLTRDMIANLSSHRPIEEFRNLYLEPDYLILDDIELMCGKESTQTEIYLVLKQRFFDNKPTMIISTYPIDEEQGFMKTVLALLSEWEHISAER